MPIFGEWQQPADRNDAGQITSALLARQGAEFISNDQADWHRSLNEAYAGLLTTPARQPGIAGFIGTDPNGNSRAHVQLQRYRVVFTYPPTADTPPAGATVEFEAPAGVPLAAGTFSGNYQNNASGGFEFGFSARRALTEQDWYTPSTLTGLAVLGSFAYVAPVGGLIQTTPYSFTVTTDDTVVVMAWTAITTGALPTFAQSGNLILPAGLAASRLYRPPRWRFVYPDVLVTPPLRMRQRDDGPRRQGRNGATSVQASVRQVGRGGYV